MPALVMSDRAPAAAGSRRKPDRRVIFFRRLWALALAAALLGGSALVVWPRPFLSEGGGTLVGSSRTPFTLTYPSGWEPMGEDQLRSQRGHPLAVIARADRKARVVVMKERRLTWGFRKLAARLTSTLKARQKGFKPMTVKIVRTQAGKALFYSYAVSRQPNLVHSVLFVPARSQSYLIRVAAVRGSTDAGREAVAILSSLRVAPDARKLVGNSTDGVNADGD